MPEATTMAGTVGMYVSGFLMLLVSSLPSAHMSRSLTSSKKAKATDVLWQIRKTLERLQATEQAQLDILLRLEKLAGSGWLTGGFAGCLRGFLGFSFIRHSFGNSACVG